MRLNITPTPVNECSINIITSHTQPIFATFLQIDRVSHYVGLHYYVDKEMQVSGLAGCKRACEVEDEFLCRSFLFKASVPTGSYNCQLYHMDHHTLPDGPATYLNTESKRQLMSPLVSQYLTHF